MWGCWSWLVAAVLLLLNGVTGADYRSGTERLQQNPRRLPVTETALNFCYSEDSCQAEPATCPDVVECFFGKYQVRDVPSMCGHSVVIPFVVIVLLSHVCGSVRVHSRGRNSWRCRRDD